MFSDFSATATGGSPFVECLSPPSFVSVEGLGTVAAHTCFVDSADVAAGTTVVGVRIDIDTRTVTVRVRVGTPYGAIPRLAVRCGSSADDVEVAAVGRIAVPIDADRVNGMTLAADTIRRGVTGLTDVRGFTPRTGCSCRSIIATGTSGFACITEVTPGSADDATHAADDQTAFTSGAAGWRATASASDRASGAAGWRATASASDRASGAAGWRATASASDRAASAAVWRATASTGDRASGAAVWRATGITSSSCFARAAGSGFATRSTNGREDDAPIGCAVERIVARGVAVTGTSLGPFRAGDLHATGSSGVGATRTVCPAGITRSGVDDTDARRTDEIIIARRVAVAEAGLGADRACVCPAGCVAAGSGGSTTFACSRVTR
jgi:hypothetical protein